MRARPLLLILALGSLVLGLSGIHDVAWLSYLQVVIGLLGVIEASSKVQLSRGRRWLLGWGALTIAACAYFSGVAGWPLYWTLAFGLAFLVSARRPRPTRPLLE